MNIEHSNHKIAPAEKYPLTKDEDAYPCMEDWEYRSVVGIMLYLAGSNRPDISYMVHQCTRFSHNSKHSHEVGVKYIAWYLKGTKDKGLIHKNTSQKIKLGLFAYDDLFVLKVEQEF